jgi:TrmH family RNA methyltransferase
MPDSITSTQNDLIKLAHNLQKKARVRRKERKILLEGTRLFRDALQQGIKPLQVFYDPTRVDGDLLAELTSTRSPLYSVTPDIMKHISDTQQPQGIAGIFPLPKPPLPNVPERVLILDAIRDPGNMGTLIRSAAAAGVQVIVLAPECVDPYNPKVLRAGMGAHFRLPVVEANWQEISTYLQDTPTYIAAGSGKMSYSTVDWQQSWALVIGNEAHGAEASFEHLEAMPVHIPMAHETESLNAAMACTVILFEAQRQRLTDS